MAPDRVDAIVEAVAGDVVSRLDGCDPPARTTDWDCVRLVVGHPGAKNGRVQVVIDCTSAGTVVTGHGTVATGHGTVVTGHGTVVTGHGAGRIARLAAPMTFEAFIATAAASLRATAAGIRAAGDPERPLVTVAVCGGAGDTCLDAVRGRVDAYVTADLRHHPASEHLAGGGPALIDAPHRATEPPWLDDVAADVRDRTGLAVTESDLVADPWARHVPSDLTAKEQRL